MIVDKVKIIHRIYEKLKENGTLDRKAYWLVENYIENDDGGV